MGVSMLLVVGHLQSFVVGQFLVRAAIRLVGSHFLCERVNPRVCIAQRETAQTIVDAVVLIAAAWAVLVLVTPPVGRNAFIIFRAFELVLFAELAVFFVVAVPAVDDVVAAPLFGDARRISTLEFIFQALAEPGRVIAHGGEVVRLWIDVAVEKLGQQLRVGNHLATRLEDGCK